MKRKQFNQLKKRIMAVAMALTLATGLSVVHSTIMPQNQAEAATKDKKKPTFKMTGKTTITVEKDKSVTIPKVTAKDNKDGNVTKKISVTVKKGSKSYSSIAKKIKSNKKVKFTETGKYTVTYSVKDKAGNKATKKRYVVVAEPEEKKNDSTTEATTEQKTTEATTTQQPTTEKNTEATTEKPTTEQPATEMPTKPEEPTDKEWPIYDYDILTDFESYNMACKVEDEENGIELNIENKLDLLYVERCEELFKNSEYLKYFGKITATDADGNDISKNIKICEFHVRKAYDNDNTDGFLYIYVSDDKGNATSYTADITFSDKRSLDFYSNIFKISDKPLVYGKMYKLQASNNNVKKYYYA